MGSHVHAGPLTGDPAAVPRRERVDPFVAAVIFALFARTFLFQAFEVPTGSMEKSVLAGDRLLVNRFVYGPQGWGPRGSSLARVLPARELRRGDVVVFRFPPDPRRDFIKRVVGLPGESVEIRDKRVYVDGRSLMEPYAFHADDTVWPDDPDVPELRRRRDQLPPTLVPSGTYFVMGDNRDDSSDSRYWGAVPADSIEGRALLVYWSVVPRSSLSPPAGPAPSSSDLLGRTRWDRFFRPVR